MASQGANKPQRLSQDALTALARPNNAPAIEISDDEDDTELAGDEEDVPQPSEIAGSSMVGEAAEPKSAFQAPFDYSFIDWGAGVAVLNGHNRLTRPLKTTAWWWQYGVPLESSNIGNKSVYFLCRACYCRRKLHCKFNITKGSAAVLLHFKTYH
jgi:hypothetical protein